MASFKEILDQDLRTTFYNTREFAENRLIEYDGVSHNIPVVFDLDEAKNRKLTMSDHTEGLHKDAFTIRIRLSDIGKEPRHGARFKVNGELYKIAKVRTEYNELIIDLERFDE